MNLILNSNQGLALFRQNRILQSTRHKNLQKHNNEDLFTVFDQSSRVINFTWHRLLLDQSSRVINLTWYRLLLFFFGIYFDYYFYGMI